MDYAKNQLRLADFELAQTSALEDIQAALACGGNPEEQRKGE